MSDHLYLLPAAELAALRATDHTTGDPSRCAADQCDRIAAALHGATFTACTVTDLRLSTPPTISRVLRDLLTRNYL